MAKEYAIKILGWKKYQNREVKHKSQWLRFQNDFIESPNFSEFTSDERVVWVYALCCASKLNTDTLRVPDQCSHHVLHRCTGIDENTFHRAFRKLKKIQVVEIRTTRGRYANDTSTNMNDTLRDETRRNEDETETETRPYLAPPSPPQISTEDLGSFAASCKATWKGTLEHHGYTRGVSSSEELAIARAIRIHGAECVDLALFGARVEPKHDDYDPKDYLSVERIFGKTKDGKLRFTDYMNWGDRERKRLSIEREKKRKSEAEEREIQDSHVDPAKVRALINQTFGRKAK